MFDPKISKEWTWSQLHPSKDNLIPLQEYANNLMAIGAVPELLEVLNAATTVIKNFYDGRREHTGDSIIDDIDKLWETIHELQIKHGKE